MKIMTTDGTYIIPLLSSNNPLLIGKDGKYIMVDTGRKRNWKAIENKLDKILGSNPLQALIITHAHYDHVENAVDIKNKYKTKIIIHRTEAEYIKNGIGSPLPVWAYSMGNKVNDDMYKRYYEPTNYDITVDNRYCLTEYGFNAFVIHTPGHSPGSLSIIVDNEYAIVSDALGGMKGKSFNKKIRKASPETIKSWETLIDFKCHKYITAHNGIKEHNIILDEYNHYIVNTKKGKP